MDVPTGGRIGVLGESIGKLDDDAGARALAGAVTGLEDEDESTWPGNLTAGLATRGVAESSCEANLAWAKVDVPGVQPVMGDLAISGESTRRPRDEEGADD